MVFVFKVGKGWSVEKVAMAGKCSTTPTRYVKKGVILLFGEEKLIKNRYFSRHTP